MFNVLVANQDKNEGERWRNQLKKKGYGIMPECLDLSTLVYILAQEKVHFVVCSTNLIGHNAFVVLNSVLKFFPRIKLILVGKPRFTDISTILNNTSNVVVKKDFDTDLEKYRDSSVTAVDLDGRNPESCASVLFDEHFLSYEEAAHLLGKSFPKFSPGYCIIVIVTDSFYDKVYQSAVGTLKSLNRGRALKIRPNEVCVVLDNSPAEELCTSTADAIRRDLLKKTDAMFSIGISRERTKAAELYICVNEARRAASAQHLYGRNSVIHINFLGDNDIEYAYPANKERRLIEQVLDGNKEYAIKMLDEIFQVFSAREALPQSLINKYALGIMVGLNIAASARAKAFEKIQLDSLSLGKLMAAKTLQDTYLFMKDGIEAFADEMDALTDIKRDVLYIELSKLKDKGANITVLDLLQTFHTTVYFLNNTIAKNTGGNIFDFIERVSK